MVAPKGAGSRESTSTEELTPPISEVSLATRVPSTGELGSFGMLLYVNLGPLGCTFSGVGCHGGRNPSNRPRSTRIQVPGRITHRKRSDRSSQIRNPNVETLSERFCSLAINFGGVLCHYLKFLVYHGLSVWISGHRTDGVYMFAASESWTNKRKRAVIKFVLVVLGGVVLGLARLGDLGFRRDGLCGVLGRRSNGTVISCA